MIGGWLISRFFPNVQSFCTTPNSNGRQFHQTRRFHSSHGTYTTFYRATYPGAARRAVVFIILVLMDQTNERRLLLIIFWKAAFVWVTPYLVQLTFSLEACSWKNGDLVFERWSFFSILETCMGIDDPYVKKPRWRRNWNAISKMIKDGLAEGMVTRKLCVEVLDLVLTSFQTSFFSGHHE